MGLARYVEKWLPCQPSTYNTTTTAALDRKPGLNPQYFLVHFSNITYIALARRAVLLHAVGVTSEALRTVKVITVHCCSHMILCVETMLGHLFL